MGSMTFTEIQNIRLHDEIWLVVDGEPVSMKVCGLKTDINFKSVRIEECNLVIEVTQQTFPYNLFSTKVECLDQIKEDLQEKINAIDEEISKQYVR